MTDSASSTNNLENLVAEYESGVENRQSSDVRAWLNARDEIENHWDELTSEQVTRVEDTDATLVENAGEVAARLAATEGGSLRDLRQATTHSPEQWWWYLDVLSHVSDQIGAGAAKAQPTPWYSQLIVVVEWVVIAVAVFVIARNLIPQLSAQNTGSTVVNPPTQTPAPTPTVDASAFDLSAATVYKAPSDILEINLPKGWTAQPSTTPGRYNFTTGDPTSPTASIQVVMDDPKTLYASTFQLTSSVAGPKEALQALGKNAPPDGSVTFSEVTASKVGSLDGFVMTINVKASAQGPAQVVELRLAPLPNGKVVFVGIQTGDTVWSVGKATLEKMIDTLVLNPNNVPTATPTSTPHPLELTQTALAQQAATVQAQINALTPSPTPVPTQAATGAATGVATGSASSAGTGAATPPATSAATPAATSGS